MTEKNLAAKRRNGRKSRGAVAPRGKAHSAEAKLLHGFYSRAQDEALIALGEDPKEYARLLQSMVSDLDPRAGLQSELVLGMGRTLWRMRRAEQMQDGLALKRVQSGLQVETLTTGPRMLHIHGIDEGLCAIGRMLNRPESRPSRAEIQNLVNAFGANPPDDVQKLFPLLRSFGEAASKAPGPAVENGNAGPIPPGEGQERESARQKLFAALDETMSPYRRNLDSVMEESEKVSSPENIAALMAPRDKNALLVQSMEDSSLRQLWRLTNVLFWARNGALTLRDVKNEGTSGDVYENKGDDDKMSSEKHAFYTKMHQLRTN
jgi:hypothetical protein